MRKISSRLAAAIVVAGLALVSHLTVHHQQRQKVRLDILALRANYLQLVRSQSDSLKDQFTPGFKGQHVFRPGLVFSQGEIFRTQQPAHLAVNGCGCFGVARGQDTLYTRDGRFEFSNGVLSTTSGWPVLGYPIEDPSKLGELKLALDPVTKLYGGKYAGFHFDESGRCFGDSRLTDPVTGQILTTSSEPLFQVALFNLHKPEEAGHPAFLKAVTAVPGRCGEGALGGICPGSLERSNVDTKAQAFVWQLCAQNGLRWWSAGMPSSAVQSELRWRFEWDVNLRAACLDNLRHAMEPGYRSTDVMAWLCGQGPLQISQRQGPLIETKCDDDLAMDGDGYFLLKDGRWSRSLNLSKDQPMGEKWLGEGFSSELCPVVVPPDASLVQVEGDGTVRWYPLNAHGGPIPGYRLRLGKAARVTQAGHLVRPYTTPEFGYAGKSEFGLVCQGYLELSNEDGYQRRILGAALMEWAGLPLFPDSLERRPDPPAQNPFPAGMFTPPPGANPLNPALTLMNSPACPRQLMKGL